MKIKNSFCYKQLPLIIVMLLFNACATQPQFITQYPLELDTAIRLLTNELLDTVIEKQRKEKQSGQHLIILDPIIDADSGQVVQVSRQIETIVIDEVKQKFTQFTINRMTSQNLPQATYIINGTIKLDDYQRGGVATKYYRVDSSVVDLKTGLLIDTLRVWIAETNLDYKPVASYEDSPVYSKDSYVDNLIDLTQSKLESSEHQYYGFLETQALLVEAESNYDHGDYKTALSLFSVASQRKDGNTVRTYAGLYETYLKLKDDVAAETAFRQLLEASVAQANTLQVKFLFQVDSVDFIENKQLRQQYIVWLRQIGQFFSRKQYCVQIEGHSSHTGTEHYNNLLSLKRAEKIQSLILTEYPDLTPKIQAVGKGYTGNIVGTGTDDARDAIDRRVEFKVVSCQLS